MRILFIIGLLLAMSPRLLAGDVLTARFADDLTEVTVELCFDGAAPERLYRNNRADRWSADILHKQHPIKVREYDGTVRLPTLADDSCLNWQVDLDAAAASLSNRTLIKFSGQMGEPNGKPVGNYMIMNADVWFWQGPKNRDLSVRMLLPDGTSFSTPWQYSGRDGGFETYLPDNTPPSWEAKLAVGHFKIALIDIPGLNVPGADASGAQLRLAMPGNLSEQQRNKLTAWIQEAAAAISLVSGRFPISSPQVLIIPAGNRGRADMFGQVLRGGGVATTFYVNETRPLQEFSSGWTATHEFSHMLLPYISSRDRWLSEGLASYYQNVLRARDGRWSATDGWQGLYDGFERGKQATNGGTLAQATQAGRASTMRVYWSGAALMLMADTQLRQSSNAQQSLDSALALLAECCLENGRTWRAKTMFEQLDRLTGTRIFMNLYQKYVNSDGFPDLQNTWDTLGIEVDNDRVTIKKAAPLAGVRNAIMKG